LELRTLFYFLAFFPQQTIDWEVFPFSELALCLSGISGMYFSSTAIIRFTRSRAFNPRAALRPIHRKRKSRPISSPSITYGPTGSLVLRKSNYPHSAEPSVTRARSRRDQLMAILCDEDARNAFREFIELEFAIENLLFLEAVRGFELRVASRSTTGGALLLTTKLNFKARIVIGNQKKFLSKL
jgi:hypothetical protein